MSECLNMPRFLLKPLQVYVEYGSSIIWFATALALFLIALFQAARVSNAFSDAVVSLLVRTVL
jgi:hypothetical protein